MWTVEQWRVIPDDLFRHQIIGGVHFAQRAPSLRHQAIVGNLMFRFDLGADHLGEIYTYVGVELSPHDAVVPDLIFVTNDQRQILTDRYVEGAPAIIIELVEEDTRDMDERIKRDLYERVGVREYWLVNCETEDVTLLRRHQSGFEEVERHDPITSPILPGFELPVNQIFAE